MRKLLGDDRTSLVMLAPDVRDSTVANWPFNAGPVAGRNGG